MVPQELWDVLLAYNLLRFQMAQMAYSDKRGQSHLNYSPPRRCSREYVFSNKRGHPLAASVQVGNTAPRSPGAPR